MAQPVWPARYRIDPESLRETIENPAELTLWLDAALARTPPADPDDERAHRTAIGVAARMLERLDEAEIQLGRAVELATRPRDAVLARVRLAHVHQWQGRFTLAESEFRHCLRDAHLAGDQVHVVYQHAGMCAYDAGDWVLARERFATAMRLRLYGGDEELIEATRMALDAADAAVTASRVGVELDRLVPAVHKLTATRLAPAIFDRHGLPPHAGTLVELGLLGVSKPVPLEVVRGLHRYVSGLEARLDALVAAGWLLKTAKTVVVSSRGRALLRQLAVAQAQTARTLWGEPVLGKSLADEIVLGAVGTSGGPVFDAVARLAEHNPDPGVAGDLFHRLNALRHHRADGHAAAWQADGHTVRSVRRLAAGSPERIRIDALTDRIAARAFRPLSHQRRTELLSVLSGLRHEPLV
ncbi:hypothetical protein [Amycolatopsis sp. YIM 10]|uniref:hypothetical protein n=1 Tax=Amycolatopsis sp. YIM 10 TaxID=2653857 RepID=UPI0012905A2E|nr:hypothetical protein [Amycolatopsis sp. YIM 10]QFU91404.1 hypothetical protein YIM_31190 [Amycolatopsis sp. YIM 10]